jgi:hypothetical protein
MGPPLGPGTQRPISPFSGPFYACRSRSRRFRLQQAECRIAREGLLTIFNPVACKLPQGILTGSPRPKGQGP